ncbi:MAG TPA: hypothetical protein VK779_07715 [Rhizomicrobium sp.]|jgi:hypothetical protein|nr:hypothetical protein [Rhizomicrobium sp.]
MSLIARREESIAAGPPHTRKKYLQEDGASFIGSVLLHILAAIVVLFLLSKTGLPSSHTVTRFLPVEIVQLDNDKDGDTASPPEQHRSLVFQQQSFHVPVPVSASPRPVGETPQKMRPPVDELQTKLQSLAKLRQPDTPLVPLESSPQASTDSTSPDAAAGDEASYGVKDLIRAQVERRWLLDLALLGKRDFRVPIHVEVTRDGKVLLAEIVDKRRYNSDAAYREIALSAHNAVILSSPFALPPNYYKDVTDITLNLDPRDALH